MIPQVLRINDKPVSNLREVVAAIDGAKTPYLRLDMDYDQVTHSNCFPIATETQPSKMF